MIKHTPEKLHVLLKRLSVAYILWLWVRMACLMWALCITLLATFVIATNSDPSPGAPRGFDALYMLPVDVLMGWIVLRLLRPLIGLTCGARDKRGSYISFAAREDRYVLVRGTGTAS